MRTYAFAALALLGLPALPPAAFAAEGKVKATIESLPLESINDVFERMKKGQVNGRVVLDMKRKHVRDGGDKAVRELIHSMS